MSMAQSLQQVQACQQAVNPHPEIAGNFPLDDAVLDGLKVTVRCVHARVAYC